jgi:hypothetical protein
MRRNFVYTTERYEEEAKHYSASQEITKIRKKALIPEYEPKTYDSFPGNYHKVVYNNNFRIVLTSKDIEIGDQPTRIYVALRVFKKGDKEYERFHKAATPDKERDTISGKMSLIWDEFIEKAKKDLFQPIVIEEKEDLSVGELNFLQNPLNINHKLFDVTIYETNDWIKNIQEVDFTDFSNAAETIETFIFENLNCNEGWYVIEFKENAILTYHHREDWILSRILKRRKDKNYDEFMREPVPFDFQRGYPFDFLKDKDVWREMERDKKSNMVLSQKQVDIVSGDIQFPLFLTGRAGSGKSTVLQYIFAEVILRYLNVTKQFEGQIKRPLYLSYSVNLIRDAFNLCKTLFKKNNAYTGELNKYQFRYEEDIAPLMNEIFWVFSDLLRNCINRSKPGEAERLFPKGGDNYISFPLFYSKWNLKFGKIRDAAKKYGPSISWHVIRTYIKGWNSNDYMTPEEYANIGDKNQTVDIETFKYIYENVWKNWYSTLDGAWDDQDLVRYCLDNNLVEDRFSAVFCDESQDFTRVEIDFILKSSSFSNRNISNLDIVKKLPFVFAGDEFQTLNPTGFSWESLRSYFTERLCDFTGLSNRKNELRIPDPIELSENFRSTREIVKLANRIQLLRASRFGEYSKPQLPHFSQDGNFVYCFSPKDKQTIEQLKEKHIVLIVPTNDGESVKEFIANSPLKEQISFDGETPQGIIILNPTQAKGLEYPNVAVFGFNCDSPNEALRLDNLSNWFESSHKNSIQDIGLKYQVSNAYVAVTRASANLYIIDEFDKNSFWAFAFNHDDDKLEKQIQNLQEDMFEKLSNSQQQNWSDESLGWINFNPEINLSDENLEHERSEEHKYDLKNRAMSLRDAGLMRQAASRFKAAGNKKDEAECKARAFAFEEDYLQAAEWFAKAQMFDAAVNSYWTQIAKTKDKAIIKKISTLKDNTQNKKAELCFRCVNNPTVRDFKLALDEAIVALKSDNEEFANHAAWQFVIDTMLKELRTIDKSNLKEIPIILSLYSELGKLDISLDTTRLAILVYNSGDLDNAIILWEQMDKLVRPSEYYQAKLKQLKYPETIEYYEGTNDPNWNNSLLEDYRKYPKMKLTEIQKRIIVSAIRNTENANKEFYTFFPFMLRSAINVENSLQVLKDSESYGCKFNHTVFKALIEARYSNLEDWNRPSVQFIDPEAGLLFDAIEAVKRIRKDDFVDYLTRSLKAMKVSEFCKDYRRFSRKVISKLIFVELGKVFEAKGRFIDALNFYEWAKKQTDDETQKREMDIRWIACKERQAENDDSEAYRNDALQKRHDLKIAPDEKLPLTISMSSIDWENIFEYYKNTRDEVKAVEITNSSRKDIDSSDNNGISDNKAEESPQSTIAQNAISKQELKYGDFTVILFPSKGDVVIKNSEEYSVRIRKGKFPLEADFYLLNERMLLTEDNSLTPFMVNCFDDHIVLKIYDGDVFTGISISMLFNQ